MSDRHNPYTPGRPVTDPELFVGRREVLASIREGLAKGRRVFVLSGARRMGKTSLLRQVQAQLPDGYVGVLVGLAEVGARQADWLLWRLAQAIAGEASQRPDAPAPEPAWAEFQGHLEHLAETFWPQVRARFGGRRLVLLLDDLDSLSRDGSRLLPETVAALAQWLAHDRDVALVATTTVPLQVAMPDRTAPGSAEDEGRALLAGAHAYDLGPLSSEEAIRLITWPVDGVLAYDYGVPRRLVEVTSAQPYYLQLLCFEVFNRCAASGWVNQRDLDLVLDDLLGRDIAEFRQVVDESSPTERAALAALVSLRGARGVATVREVHDLLAKGGAKAGLDQVEETLDRLTGRGILEQLGALSYRFRVALLRSWLAKRLDAREVIRTTRWPAQGRGKPRGDVGTRRRGDAETRRRGDVETRRRGAAEAARRAAAAQTGAAAGQSQEGDTPRPAGRRRAWPWLAGAAVLALALIAAAAFGLPQLGGARSTPTVAASLSPTRRLPTALAPTATAHPTAVARPSATPTPEPTATSSPTAPVVVARALPSIAYLSRTAKGEPWILYVMNSDGSNRLPLIEAPSDFISAPSWSPDGSRIAFVSDRDGNADIWVMDTTGHNAVNLTRNTAKDHTPAWSPDGQWIAFASVRDSLYYELYVMRPDGAGVQRLSWWEDASDLSPSWLPGGATASAAAAEGGAQGGRLAFASKRDKNWELYSMDRDGSNLLRLTDNPADDTSPAWSPDGSTIAFESTRDGYVDIYALPVAGGEVVNLTKLSWATDLGPTWSPDGGRIAFYSDRDGEWDIYVMNSDGSNVVKLTGDESDDQLPAWRP